MAAEHVLAANRDMQKRLEEMLHAVDTQLAETRKRSEAVRDWMSRKRTDRVKLAHGPRANAHSLQRKLFEEQNLTALFRHKGGGPLGRIRSTQTTYREAPGFVPGWTPVEDARLLLELREAGAYICLS